jgi:predicted alpha/beta hydrolase
LKPPHGGPAATITETALQLRTDDGVSVALWKLQGARERGPRSDVFMTHGTFSDRRVCLGLARHLASLGHTCWILEWRGHGSSQQDVAPFDMETVALFDVKAALTHLLEREGIKRLDCVTHSGGGLALTMCLVRHRHLVEHIGKVVLFACQSCHAAVSRLRWLQLLATKLAGKLMGRLPGKRLGIGIQDESYTMMKQWFDWNLTRTFTGHDGLDYLAQMPSIGVPVMAVFAEGDRFIAPPAACQQYLEAFKSERNKALHCATAQGFSQNFDHAGVMHSSAAKREIWPAAQAWLEQEPPARYFESEIQFSKEMS